jgi:phage shock protein C
MSDPKIIEGTAREMPASRRLYRSITNRSVAGVCGGLGEVLGADVGLIRLAWLVSVFLTLGLTLIPYAVLAWALPKETAEHAAAKHVRTSDLWERIRSNSALLWGGLLLLIGAVLLLNNFDVLPWRLEAIWRAFWALALPLALIALGVFLVLSFTGHAPDWRQWRRLRASGSRLPLWRSRQDRVLSGVCGGLAAYLDIDSLVVRIGWVVLTVLTGGIVGLALYLLAVFFIPLESDPFR